MGTQCAKATSKQTPNEHETRMGSLQNQLRGCEENLLFTMTIQHLSLTNMKEKVKQIKFSLESQFQIVYRLNEFSIQENIIKSQKIHKTQFNFPANSLDSKKVLIEIINFNDQVIENLTLKLIHLCTGPIHHDHLLKQLKARLMFDLHIFQNINVSAKCKNFKISLNDKEQQILQNLSYKFILTTEIDEKTFSSHQGFLTNDLTFEEQKILVSIPNNILKQSNFRFQILMSNSNGNELDQNTSIIHSIFVPYGKILNFQISTSIRKKQIQYVKKCITFNEIIKNDEKIIGNVEFELEVQSSILYAQQMECLIFSQIGVSFVSPTFPFQLNDSLVSQLKEIYRSVKKIKKTFPEQKQQLIKNIDEIYLKFQKTNEEIFTSQDELYERQITLVKLLNELSSFFSEGEDILNQRLWRIIHHIVHKPELSIRYLTLHQNQNTKKQIYFIYYKFIISVLSKIIVCTGTGITFHQLQCIQKFVAFSYFRFPWIQDKILGVLHRKQDPVITQQKLIELGANSTVKSPSKSYIYDWEKNVYRKIENTKEFQEIIQKLEQTSSEYEDWDQLLFNRNDEDLFYGIYLQIWNEAQITLKNLRGKILWQYFPNYGQLLSCFLGQMNNSKLSDFSTLFKQCSNKLVLNQKLLNTFVVLLFPKTYLFQISCVLKCLNLLQSYFQVVTKQNKKLPHDFHFNFFYTGVKTIIEQGHSYLVVKVLQILYKFYDIFTQDFKKSLNSFLLSHIFYKLFLHWCTNVRRIFHHLIYFRILQKKIANPEQETHVSAQRKSTKSLKKIDVSFTQQYFINRKFNLLFMPISNYCSDSKKEKISEKKHNRMEYYQKMKQKLFQMKKKKEKEVQKYTQLSESKVSEDGKSSSFMIRKKSLFTQNLQFECIRVRKMSVGDEIYSEKIDEQYKRYCYISLLEYEQVKRVINSEKQVEELARLVQGDIDS